MNAIKINVPQKTKLKSGQKTAKIVFKVLLYIFFIVLTALSVLPFYYMIVNATHTTPELKAKIYWTFGNNFTKNIEFLTKNNFDFFVGFKNSSFIAIGATILSVYISTLAAYAITAYRFRGREALFILVLVLLMVPTQLSAVGFFRLVNALNLRDNLLAFILPAAVAPSTVFFMRQYMKANLPLDFVESARIDGAMEIGIFHRIVFPLLVPAAATMAIFSMIANWNSFFLPKIVLESRQNWTLPIMVDKLKGDIYRVEVSAMYAGLMLTTVPLLIFYALLSKFIISGVALGGIKE